MKKLFLILFAFTIQLSAQNWIPQGNGYTYTVTIKYGGVATSDSIENVDLDLQYGDFTSIFVEGNANGTDSVVVRAGAKSFLVAGITASDTVWGSYVPLKDSSGTVVNTIVNNTVGKHYWISEPNQDVLQFQLINYRAALATRSVTLVIKTKKTVIE